jgi:hypothetical protein
MRCQAATIQVQIEERSRGHFYSDGLAEWGCPLQGVLLSTNEPV